MTATLSLGTAQFGFNYGVANQLGQPSLIDVDHILDTARQLGIHSLDTAIAYGESEQVLGQLGVKDFKIVTKLPSVPSAITNIQSWVDNQCESSLQRLGVQSVYGLLMHRPENLLGQFGKDIIVALQRIKAAGYVEKIGVSIYDPAELDELTQIMKVDLVQAPLNLMDRRFQTSGWLRRLHQGGIEIHTRSTFLQGLLLMPRHKIPEKFERWSAIWNEWQLKLQENNLSALTACLAYPLSLPEVDQVIVGVDSAEHLKMITLEAKKETSKQDWSFMASEDQRLINPSNWDAL